jgi:hypothetical protein
MGEGQVPVGLVSKVSEFLSPLKDLWNLLCVSKSPHARARGAF